MTRIGLISDTHGFLDPRVTAVFRGVEQILHAGDIGGTRIITELERIAPVTAVLGNNDEGLPYPALQVLEWAGRKFLVHHIVQPRHLEARLKARILEESPAVIIFGHSHQRCQETIGGILYLNPGYAGKPRFKLPRSVAVLTCAEAKLEVRFAELP